MTLLSPETNVFAGASDGRCVVIFLAAGRPRSAAGNHGDRAASVLSACEELANEGWLLSAREMFTGDKDGPYVYETGFAHDVDIAGVFEAPTLPSALTGISHLESAGWESLYKTQWLIGPREFAPVRGSADGMEPSWGFLALWQWNDAWQQASSDSRREYDEECDRAFSADLKSGINIAGRHRLDWASQWDHLGLWEATNLDVISDAMREHERVADFKYTTSRHYIGKRARLATVLGK
jgi:hypothetical protein